MTRPTSSSSWLAGVTTNQYVPWSRVSINFEPLANAIDNLSNVAKSKINTITQKGSAMSITDMFDLQMAMNRLSQFSEMSTSVISAMQAATMSIARGIKS